MKLRVVICFISFLELSLYSMDLSPREQQNHEDSEQDLSRNLTVPKLNLSRANTQPAQVMRSIASSSASAVESSCKNMLDMSENNDEEEEKKLTPRTLLHKQLGQERLMQIQQESDEWRRYFHDELDILLMGRRIKEEEDDVREAEDNARMGKFIKSITRFKDERPRKSCNFEPCAPLALIPVQLIEQRTDELRQEMERRSVTSGDDDCDLLYENPKNLNEYFVDNLVKNLSKFENFIMLHNAFPEGEHYAKASKLICNLYNRFQEMKRRYEHRQLTTTPVSDCGGGDDRG